MKLIKLSEAAKILGVTKQTLYNWRRAGKITFITSQTGINFLSDKQIDELQGVVSNAEERVVIYVRVSSTQNKTNLKSQSERLQQYCIAKGYSIHKVVEEFGSGFNDNRPKLQKLLKDNDYTKIVVEHKDRLTRAGFEYINTLVELQGKEIEVVNQVDTDEQSIIQDFVSIITSFTARIYGQRRSKRNTERLISELLNKNE
jgi:predicted site-specific integrase-resolvase